MAKKKRGGVRGRGMQGPRTRNNYGYRGGNRPVRPASYDHDAQQPADAPDNGEVGPLEPGGGVLEMHPNGYGFLRDPKNNYTRELTDPFVPGSMIDKFGLREGLHLTGLVQPGRRNQGPRLREIHDVDGMPPEKYPEVKTLLIKLTPINPETWLPPWKLGPEPMTTRVMQTS